MALRMSRQRRRADAPTAALRGGAVTHQAVVLFVCGPMGAAAVAAAAAAAAALKDGGVRVHVLQLGEVLPDSVQASLAEVCEASAPFSFICHG